MIHTKKISKLDASRRQIDTAIRLFFIEGDIVSVHTLTCAAHQILMDMDAGSIVKEDLLKMIRSDKHKEWFQTINKAENFFKHADKDAGDILDFSPTSTEHLLWDACIMYYKLTGEMTELIKIYQAWYYMEHPEMLEEKHKLLAEAVKKNQDSKREFFDYMLSLSGQF